MQIKSNIRRLIDEKDVRRRGGGLPGHCPAEPVVNVSLSAARLSAAREIVSGSSSTVLNIGCSGALF